MKRRTLWIAIGTGVVAAVAAGLVWAQLQPGILVETATVKRTTLRETISEEGQTRARNRYTVTAPVAGQVGAITLREGDLISKGQVLAYIHPAPESPRERSISQAQASSAAARRDEAAANVQQSIAELEQIDKKTSRNESLREKRLISAEEIELTQLELASKKQQLAAARATLRAAEADLQAAQLRIGKSKDQSRQSDTLPVSAHQNGVVLAVLEKSERVVQAGTPLIQIGDTSNLEIVIAVLSEDAVKIERGDALQIADWGGTGVLDGTVTLVEPNAFTETSTLGVQEQRVNVIANLNQPASGLGTGYRVEAQIIIWQGDDVLSVPTSALFQSNGKWQVFAIENGKAAQKSVEIGHRSTNAAEVTSGLDEGAVVILFPSDLVDDGVKVASE